MRPEFLAYAIYAYLMVGFMLWLWAWVDDYVTGNRHRHRATVAIGTLIFMLLGWPFLARDLLKPRRKK